MNIAEAKQIDIVEYLKNLNIVPHHHNGNRYWYCSPYRSENTPSFKVDAGRNDWYDFGTDEGGDLIDLCKKLYETDDTSTVLRKIAENAPAPINSNVPARNAPPDHPQEPVFRNVEFRPLSAPSLQSYIISRKVDLNLAKVYCCEVRYTFRGKNYFAIAFRNRTGGCEIRNRYFKGCIGHKDITFLPYRKDCRTDECCIFEGFMDFLSYITVRDRTSQDVFADIEPQCDIIVLNTVACLKRAIGQLSHYRAIHCFFDNDEAGRRTTASVREKYPLITVDESYRYTRSVDVNDYLVMHSL